MERDKIYEEFKQKIIWLDLPPETVLNLSTLASTIGLSRTPVKEALIILESEAWLVRQDSHFIVTPLSIDPIQMSATAALKGSTDFMKERKAMYQERRDVVTKALTEIGLELEKLKATFYVWASITKGYGNSKDFSFKVLDEIAVWIIPGSTYGQYGEGCFRIALTHPTNRLAEAMG